MSAFIGHLVGTWIGSLFWSLVFVSISLVLYGIAWVFGLPFDPVHLASVVYVTALFGVGWSFVGAVKSPSLQPVLARILLACALLIVFLSVAFYRVLSAIG